MIRFILCVIVVVGFLILSIPILLVEWIIGKFNPMAKEISSLRIVQAVFRFILWVAGVKLTVIGEENVPTDVPVLYIGNHRSFFDVPLTYPRCPIRTGYIAKKEMEKVPLLSTWMKRLHCLFLDRNDLKQGLKTILTAIEKVKSGISICIFPEGTRNKNEDELDMLPFQRVHETKMKMNWTCFHSMREASKLPQRQTVRSSRWRSAAPLISGKTIFQELRKPTLSWSMAPPST